MQREGEELSMGSPMDVTNAGFKDYFASQSQNNASDDGDRYSFEESDIDSHDIDEMSWTTWFCMLRGNEFFCQVDDNFIKDDFNRVDLSSQVLNYRNALLLILDESRSKNPPESIKKDAKKLYGLIHARYILTEEGLNAMSFAQLYKFKNSEFEKCPRYYCFGQMCLPVGLSDIPKKKTVKLYCPKCKDIYYPQNKCRAKIDGAYFGTTFPHMFLMTYEDLKPEKGIGERYVARIFGYKVHDP